MVLCFLFLFFFFLYFWVSLAWVIFQRKKFVNDLIYGKPIPKLAGQHLIRAEEAWIKNPYPGGVGLYPNQMWKKPDTNLGPSHCIFYLGWSRARPNLDQTWVLANPTPHQVSASMSIMPNLLIRCSRLGLASPFVKMSIVCWPEGINGKHMVPISSFSLMKYRLISMCFIHVG